MFILWNDAKSFIKQIELLVKFLLTSSLELLVLSNYFNSTYELFSFERSNALDWERERESIYRNFKIKTKLKYDFSPIHHFDQTKKPPKLNHLTIILVSRFKMI